MSKQKNSQGEQSSQPENTALVSTQETSHKTCFSTSQVEKVSIKLLTKQYSMLLGEISEGLGLLTLIGGNVSTRPSALMTRNAKLQIAILKLNLENCEAILSDSLKALKE